MIVWGKDNVEIATMQGIAGSDSASNRRVSGYSFGFNAGGFANAED